MVIVLQQVETTFSAQEVLAWQLYWLIQHSEQIGKGDACTG